MERLLVGSLAATVLLGLSATRLPGAGAAPAASKPATALSATVKDIDGKPVDLRRHLGSVVMIVNVASQCGQTPQYAGLQKLHEQYRSRGFTVLGFPSNDFGQQEPGTEKEIKAFCTTRYQVTFPMFSKVVVKGEGQSPVYRFLTDKQTNPKYGGEVGWNFEKFLLNRKGEVVGRWDSNIEPTETEVITAIEKELAASKG